MRRALPAAILIGYLLAGCGGDDGAASTPTVTTSPVPTAAVATSRPAPATTALQASSTAATFAAMTTLAGPPVNVVGLGDSYPAAVGCGSPCRSYVALVGSAVSAALGRQVATKNLAEANSVGASKVLRQLTYSDEAMSAVSEADVVVLQVGNNDWQGPCVAQGHEECLEAGRARVEENLAKVLERITALRAGEPTAVRVVTYYNAAIDDPDIASTWHFENTPANVSEFQTWFAAALASFDDTICQVAVAGGAVCVDVRHAFNGPRHDQGAGALLLEDHFHPGPSGHQLIADEISAAGFGELG